VTPAATEWAGPLRRRVAVLLVVKLGVLMLLWGLFFSPSHRPSRDVGAIAARLLPEAASSHRSTGDE
jgi:hypothetical protein